MMFTFVLFEMCACVFNNRPGQRTVDDLEIIYEELLHIKALSHLSTTVSLLYFMTVHCKLIKLGWLTPTSVCLQKIHNESLYPMLVQAVVSPVFW